MKKTLFYAQGGGLGHLQRCANLANSLKLNTQNIFLASSSPYTKLFAEQYQFTPLLIPTNFQYDLPAYQSWLAGQIQYHKINTIFIDVFPCGIIGEWNNFNEVMPISYTPLTFHHIVRRLKWLSYVSLVKNPINFDTAYIFEDLEPLHQEFVNQFVKMQIKIPPPKKISQLDLKVENFWLIIHSEPLDELQILIEYAIEKYAIQQSHSKIVIITQIAKDKILAFLQENYPNFIPIIAIQNLLETEDLLQKAEKIFSGCGFNMMQQTYHYAHKHEFIPFERRFDDQFWRAKQRR